ncbi:divalent-cation tolerance protein CutA [Micromonospora sp. DT48]|uniref:divalent-cation tolerance protein CutA n=1 Tax=unclassified Micromonospora TaxID=2617518 RepID=UPI0013263288|nr:divalent-cation tolerance protein CutA [Micromonospora sp. CP22]MTK01036.1 divalent-cation tolerance protein CutA [Micromonospora sp. CP22]
MEQISVVTTVVDARSVADLLAAAAVAGRLAACAQVGGQVDSTYWWRSAVETSTEWSVQFKTALDRVDALVDQLRASHPYEVPEILVSRVDCGDPGYATWVFEHTRP